MKKPNQSYPSAPTSTTGQMPIYIPDPSINAANFDQLIQNRGIRFIHKRSAPCPNMKGVEENSHTPGCQFCDESGILYYDSKEIYGVFTSNSLEKLFEVQGVWDIGTAVITFPAEYADGTQADFNVYDLLICPDFEVRLSDLTEYAPDADGKIRLKFPITSIENMISVRNGSLYTYVENTDFIINAGLIEWLPGKTPSYNAATGIGEVLSITYNTNPVYSVNSMMHELRVTQRYDIATGTKIAVRLPQQVLVKKNFIYDPTNKVEQEGSR
jgi:hypothetical protein